ncbi:hypothetical protein AN191_01005 [Loktanella sp. 5RATIMAR09]|uniref:hypothetical protein n=1 Tax=Loktanella sp. 5RATIMAR09 TaxID=1225655 RepID=UPI0006EB9007|nr:hypothetical protein [Loktanella sp. 5RATIMAR09]KQI73500.1 hypothetical protein AN191_01005 [Loktanella sp. 5RATIMAR09]
MRNATFFALQGPEGIPADLASIVDSAEANGGRLSVLHVGAVPIMSYAIAAPLTAYPSFPKDGLVSVMK